MKYTFEQLELIEGYINEFLKGYNEIDSFYELLLKKINKDKYEIKEKEFRSLYLGKYVKITNSKKTFIGIVENINIQYPRLKIETRYGMEITEKRCSFDNRGSGTTAFEFNIERDKIDISLITREEFEEILIVQINKEY